MADTLTSGHRLAPAGVARRLGDHSRLRSAAVLFWVPAVAFALFFVSANATGWAANYPLAAASQANDGVVVIGPYVALAAAWEMGALRSLWGRLPVRRPLWQVLSGRLALVIGCGLAAMLTLYAVIGHFTLLTDFPGWSLPLISVISVLCWSLFGAASALVFRPLIALPAALIAPFLVISLPQGWSPLWLRRLNGYLSDCCSTTDVLDSRAVIASIGFLAAIAVCALAVIAVRLVHDPRHAPATAAVALAVAGVAVLGAWALITPASQLGPLPTATRPLAQLDCANSVCLWPEDKIYRDANQSGWDQVQSSWRALGLPLKTTRIGPVTTPTLLGVAVSTDSTDQARASMASLLPRALLGCQNDYTDQNRNDALAELAYLTLNGTGHPNPLVTPLPPNQPPPTAADADRLWSTAQACS
ncbi:MAG: hypothetical protein ABI047_05730 [Jatrophihabitantaceae bacterium]